MLTKEDVIPDDDSDDDGSVYDVDDRLGTLL